MNQEERVNHGRRLRKLRVETSQRGRFCDACQHWFPEGMHSHFCIPKAAR